MGAVLPLGRWPLQHRYTGVSGFIHRKSAVIGFGYIDTILAQGHRQMGIIGPFQQLTTGWRQLIIQCLDPGGLGSGHRVTGLIIDGSPIRRLDFNGLHATGVPVILKKTRTVVSPP